MRMAALSAGTSLSHILDAGNPQGTDKDQSNHSSMIGNLGSRAGGLADQSASRSRRGVASKSLSVTCQSMWHPLSH